MKLVSGIAFALLVAMPGLGFAAAPELRVSKSVIVHAAPGRVWARIANFGALGSWHPGVARDDVVAGAGNAIGSERRITLASGATMTEKLVAFDARHHRFRVTMLGSTLPLSGYTSVISIKGAGKNRSKVTWSGKFKRKDTGPNPAVDANDAAATTAASAFYQAGLDNLKKIVVAK
ncbi:MAG: SRPBCC family protein [Dokdonella sp.]